MILNRVTTLERGAYLPRKCFLFPEVPSLIFDFDEIDDIDDIDDFSDVIQRSNAFDVLYSFSHLSHRVAKHEFTYKNYTFYKYSIV